MRIVTQPSQTADDNGDPAAAIDLLSRLLSVPKAEYDKEREAVKNGKPLANPFAKKARRNTKMETEEETPVVHPPVKEPRTRLLDLLAGWNDFIGREEGVPDLESVTDDIGALYQEVGALDNPTDADVRAIVIDRVIPLLLR